MVRCAEITVKLIDFLLGGNTMKQTIAVFVVACLLLITEGAGAAVYTFEWTGTVWNIWNGYFNPATLEGVNVGDWFVATVTYDTDAFGPGVNVTGDGLDYPAPPGLQMTYQFESGVIFTKDITAVRARKHLSNSQWNWMGGVFGSMLFQANDSYQDAFDLPLPESFDEMHTMFLSTISMFEPTSANLLRFVTGNPADDRIVRFTDQTFIVTLAYPVADILSFFDEAVGEGDLEGTGPGSSAPHRLNALRNMIETAGELIGTGLHDEACQQLNDAYARCDGLGLPNGLPDFVSGPAAGELAALILTLMAELGCS
jgi:hypothetical protein